MERESVRVSLFEKRFSAFMSLRDLLIKNLQEGDFESDVLNQLLVKSLEAKFVFPKDVENYLKEIYDKAIELKSTNNQLKLEDLPVGAKRIESSKKAFDLKMYFSYQFEQAEEIFGKYLKFKNF